MPDDAVSSNLAKAIDDIVDALDGWDEDKRSTALQLKSAVERFHQEGLRRLLGALSRDGRAGQALRDAAGDPVVYAMLRQHQLLKPSLHEQVLCALDTVRPLLQAHAGDVELVAIHAPGEVVLRLTGACDGCGSSQVTLEAGVEKTLREHCAWIETIRVDGAVPARDDIQAVRMVSPFAASTIPGQ